VFNVEHVRVAVGIRIVRGIIFFHHPLNCSEGCILFGIDNA
jgi:hypothetical protein